MKAGLLITILVVVFLGLIFSFKNNTGNQKIKAEKVKMKKVTTQIKEIKEKSQKIVEKNSEKKETELKKSEAKAKVSKADKKKNQKNPVTESVTDNATNNNDNKDQDKNSKENELFSEILAVYKWGKLKAEDFIGFFKQLPTYKQMALSKKERFDEYVRYFVETRAAYQLAKEGGLDKSGALQWRINAEKKLLYINSFVQENVGKIEVTTQEVEAYYQKNKDNLFKISAGVEGVFFYDKDKSKINGFYKKALELSFKEKDLNLLAEKLKQLNITDYKVKLENLNSVRKGEFGHAFDKQIFLDDEFKNKVGLSPVFFDGTNYCFALITKRIPETYQQLSAVRQYIKNLLKNDKAKAVLNKVREILKNKYQPKLDKKVLKEMIGFLKKAREDLKKSGNIDEMVRNRPREFFQKLSSLYPKELEGKSLAVLKDGQKIKLKDFWNTIFLTKDFYATSDKELEKRIEGTANSYIEQELIYLEAKNMFSQDPVKKKELETKIEDYARWLITSEYITEKLNKYGKITEKEMKDYYQKNKDKFQVPEQIRVSHILVKTKDEAFKLRKEILEKKAKFEDLAKKFSLCPSKAKGGDLGYFTKGRMVPAFEKAAFSLEKIGDISPVVKTRYGYHIIKLTGRMEKEELSFEKAKDQIRNILMRMRGREVERKAREEILKLAQAKIDGKVVTDIYYYLFPSERKDKTEKKEKLDKKEVNSTRKESKKKAKTELLGIEENPQRAVIAKIGDEELTFGDFLKEYRSMPFMNPVFIGRMGKYRFLQQMVDDFVLAQKARNSKLVDKKELELKHKNMKDIYTARKVIDKIIVPKIKVSEKEMKEFYNKNKSRMVMPERAHLKEIVVKKLEEAKKIISLLKKGEDFSQLAKKYSISATARKGGDLGIVTKGRLPSFIEKDVFKLKDGQITTSPIKDGSTYRIYKMISYKKEGVVPFEEARDKIKEHLIFIKKDSFIKNYVAELRKKLHLKEDLEYLKINNPLQLQGVSQEKLFIFDKGSMTVGEFYAQIDILPRRVKAQAATFEGKKVLLKNVEDVYLLKSEADKLSNKDLAEVESEVKNSFNKVLANLMEKSLKENFKKKLSISDKDIASYYKKNIYYFTVPSQYRLQRIAVNSKKKAYEIIEKLKNGESFNYLAIKDSTDAYGARGGNMGWVQERELPHDVVKVIKKMEPNEITTIPLKIGAKYYIYKLLEFKPGHKEPLAKVRDKVLKMMEREKIEQKMKEWREKAKKDLKVEIYKDKFYKLVDRYFSK